MNDLEREMLAAGYVRCPNNAKCWYPGRAGIPDVEPNRDVLVESDRIRVVEAKLFGTPYTKKCWYDEVTVAVYETVAEFLAACPCVSQPGLPAFSNSWD